MNDILQNIMVFINEHTLLLIGICVFLILVLIGYLIDNSVKSKRVRKDIKNADQVPENIKDEIIKQAEEKGIVKEETPNVALETAPINNSIEDTLKMENPILLGDEKENSESINVPSVDTDATLNLDASFDLNTPSDLNTELNLDQKDPDADIMGAFVSGGYSNDKGLSEILFSVGNESVQVNETEVPNVDPTNIDIPSVEEANVSTPAEETNIDINTNLESDTGNIFTDNSSNIVVNDEVKKDDVQIEKNDNASDELDRIMRKLSTMNNGVGDDNYTNIF